MSSEEIKTINRDYIDNFSVKEYTEDHLVDNYFPEIEPSLRTVGTLGYVTELISNFGEDTFNTGSVLFRESFPNRAEIPESIYSHAAIFQISDVFTSPSSCKFLLVLEEEGILKNMLDDYNKDTGIYHFYIDKNTTIYVEDKPYTLDYDIELDIIKKESTKAKDEYLFTAKYVMEPYKNSISEIKYPYIKIRRSSDGYIALEVQTHQCIREVEYENIISSNMINFPIIDVPFEGDLAGFDVLYREPGKDNYIQLETRIVFSQATKSPFCYFQITDENNLRLTFNSKDSFFQPVFNSDLKVILYITEGKDGNFDTYNGDNITLVPDNEVYDYANTYLTAARPIGASQNGRSRVSIDTLQSMTVEGYRTANALTTENDLDEFFKNYRNRYGDSDALFLKKRDDVYERVYSAFLMIKDGTYIYNTNTLNLKLNISDMKNPEKNIYVLDPGYLFTSNNSDGYAEIFRNEELYNEYYAAYEEAIKNNDPDVQYITNTEESYIPEYLDRPASFAEYKRRKHWDDKVTIFDFNNDLIEEYDSPIHEKFLLINPFLIRFKKEPNLVSTYLTFVKNTSLLDILNINDPINDVDAYSNYVQFILYTLNINREFEKEKRYHVYTKLTPSINLDLEYPLIKIDPGEYVPPKKLITNDLYEESEDDIDYSRIPNYHLNDKFSTIENDLRVFMKISDEAKDVCFTELYPTEYDFNNASFTFSNDIFTDDHITSDGKLRLESGEIWREPETGNYYKIHEDDATLYDYFSSDGTLITADVPNNTVHDLKEKGLIKIWRNIWSMTSYHDILIPMTDVKCTIYTLYKRNYDKDNDDELLVLNTKEMTNNPFNVFLPDLDDEGNKSLDCYVWTNEYGTVTSPITFMKPLNSVRTFLKFEDYTTTHTEIVEGEEVTVYNNDIMDAEMKSISFVRAATALDKNKFDFFLESFYNQYLFLVDIINTRLRNCTNIDVKFYNTYGRSKYFLIGEDNGILDTVNLHLNFDVWFLQGTDLLKATPEIKKFIKKDIETINTNGSNNLYISNLMRKIENTFAYVDHIRFNEINNYETKYQAVKNCVENLDDLTVEDRRFYVPEFLVVDENDININEYFVS